MSELTQVHKDKENQKPIPTIWKGTLTLIVEAIKLNDYETLNSSLNVRTVAKLDIDRIQENIDDYGCQLISLPESTWQTSVCQWQGAYWDVLVDLYTVEEGESDLSLSVRVFEKDKEFEFEVISLHAE